LYTVFLIFDVIFSIAKRVQHDGRVCHSGNPPLCLLIMPPPPIGGVLSDAFVCPLSVCLPRPSGLSQEQRGLGKPKLAQR